MKRFFKIIGWLILLLVLAATGYVAFTFPAVMAGMAAKTMCSCVFLSDRTEQSVRDKELQVFPGLSKASITISSDSSVTARIAWKKSKAIYRRGLGCTLLAERAEDEVRAQPINVATAPRLKQDTVTWPLGDVLPAKLSPEIDSVRIVAAVREAFEEPDSTRPKNTRAVVVVYKGQIVAEQYAPGIQRHTRLMGWSMTKSITNALIGLMVKDGKLKVDAPAPVAAWANDDRRKITLNNLLQATSGLTWTESYFVPSSHFHTMFIRRDDKGGYAESLPLEFEPGTHFEYSSGTTNILSRILRQTIGDQDYYRFPYDSLFYPIGMYSAIIEADASGTFVGSSYSFASARDWARFGLLYLNDGVVNGRRILPEGWVTYTTTPAPAADWGRYGAQWHLNAGEKGNPGNRKMRALPTDTYWADGFEDQWIVVVPSHSLVVVRLGVSHHGFDIERLVAEAIAACPQ